MQQKECQKRHMSDHAMMMMMMMKTAKYQQSHKIMNLRRGTLIQKVMIKECNIENVKNTCLGA